MDNMHVEAINLDNKADNSSEVVTTNPTGVQKEAFVGKVVRYRLADIHRLSEDFLKSIGGVVGLDPNDSSSYTYTQASKTEYQFADRDNIVGSTYDFPRFIGSMVYPIYAHDIGVEIKDGDRDVEDQEFQDFLDNCDGRNISYDIQNQELAMQAHAHSCVYIVMDKVNGKVRRYVRGITSTNENYIATDDETGELNQIAFVEKYEDVEGNKWNGSGQIAKVWQRKYYTVGDACYSQKMVADWNSSKGWKDQDFEDAEAPVLIGNVGMCASAHIFVYESGGGFVPQNPKFKNVLWKCVDYHNVHNRHQWLINLYCNPTGVIWDAKTSSANGSLGSFISISSNGEDFAPKPEYIQPVGAPESESNLKMVKADLYKLMSFFDVHVTETNQAESEGSKMYDMVAGDSALNGTVRMLKKTDRWTFEMWKKLMAKPYTYSLNYPDSFFPKEDISVADAIDLSRELKDSGKIQTSELVLEKITLDNVGDKCTRDEVESIKQEFAVVNRSTDNSDGGNTEGDNDE